MIETCQDSDEGDLPVIVPEASADLPSTPIDEEFALQMKLAEKIMHENRNMLAKLAD